MAFLKTIVLVAVCTSLLPLATSDEFRTCRRSDPGFSQCLPGAFREAFIAIADGYSPKGVGPIDPLSVRDMKLTPSSGAIRLNQDATNNILRGVTKGVQATNFNVDFGRKIISLETRNPRVDLIGNYQMSGTILSMPINGSGRRIISMRDLTTQITVRYSTTQRGGQTMMRVTNFDVKFIPRRVILRYEHLEKDSSPFAQLIRNYINNNSLSFFNRLKGPYEKVIGSEFAEIANKLLVNLPMERIFPL